MKAGFLLSVVSHAALNISLGVFFGDGFSLVIVFLTAAEADLKLGSSVLVDIELKGNKSHALLGELSCELADLLLMEKKLSVAERIHVKTVPLFLRGDVHAHDDGFTVSDPDIGFLDGDLALTDGFDLGAREDYSCLVGLVHEIVVICFFVVCL